MRLVISILLTAVLAFASGLYFPWWIVAPAAFISALAVPQPPFKTFLGGFFGIFLLWLLLILMINGANDGVLALRISLVMGLGKSTFPLVVISSLAGALTGGFAALTAALFRRMVGEKS